TIQAEGGPRRRAHARTAQHHDGSRAAARGHVGGGKFHHGVSETIRDPLIAGRVHKNIGGAIDARRRIYDVWSEIRSRTFGGGKGGSFESEYFRLFDVGDPQRPSRVELNSLRIAEAA